MYPDHINSYCFSRRCRLLHRPHLHLPPPRHANSPEDRAWQTQRPHAPSMQIIIEPRELRQLMQYGVDPGVTPPHSVSLSLSSDGEHTAPSDGQARVPCASGRQRKASGPWHLLEARRLRRPPRVLRPPSEPPREEADDDRVRGHQQAQPDRAPFMVAPGLGT